MKKAVCVFVLMFLAAGACAWAGGSGCPMTGKATCPVVGTAEAAEAVVDAGNTVCPVTGEKVSGRDFTTFQGKKYGMCCGMCADTLKANPDKYLGKDGEVLKEPKAGTQEAPVTEPMPEGHVH